MSTHDRAEAACTERVLAAIADTEREVTPTTRPILDEIRRELSRPLRVAVTGRVNAGKSTLVNALLRRRIAPTDVTECTRYACWFQYGVPERVEVVGPDGTRRPLTLRADGRLPAAIGDLDDLDVARIDVFLSNEILERMTIIDTPGLASSRDDVQLTDEVLAFDRRTRAALVQADAMVFVSSGGVRADDAERLRDFHALMGGLAPTSVNTLAVIGRIDQSVDVDDDPMVAIAPVTAALRAQLRSLVADVLPVVSLQAETAECGALTDADLRLLAALAADRTALDRAMLSVDRFVRSEQLPGDPDHRARLLELLDLHGMRLMTSSAQDGTTPAAAIQRLRAGSGIDAVRRSIVDDLGGQADLLKANWALGAIQDQAFRVAAADRDRLVDLAERIELDPRLHRISEVSALQELAGGHPDLDVVDVEEVRRLVHGRSAATRLGLDPAADPGAVRDAAVAGVARWRGIANDGGSGPALRSVAGVLARSYELILTTLTTLTTMAGDLE